MTCDFHKDFLFGPNEPCMDCTMNTTETTIRPAARRFYRLFLDDKRGKAKDVLRELGSETERIAVVVDALQQSGWSYKFSAWIQSWHTSDTIPHGIGAAEKVIRKAQEATFDGTDRRGFREGRTFRVGDRVRVDGHSFGVIRALDVDLPWVMAADTRGIGGLTVEIEGQDERVTLARFRVHLLD